MLQSPGGSADAGNRGAERDRGRGDPLRARGGARPLPGPEERAEAGAAPGPRPGIGNGAERAPGAARSRLRGARASLARGRATTRPGREVGRRDPPRRADRARALPPANADPSRGRGRLPRPRLRGRGRRRGRGHLAPVRRAQHAARACHPLAVAHLVPERRRRPPHGDLGVADPGDGVAPAPRLHRLAGPRLPSGHRRPDPLPDLPPGRGARRRPRDHRRRPERAPQRRLRPRGGVRLRLRDRARADCDAAPWRPGHPHVLGERPPLPRAILMRLPLDWLREYVAVDAPVEELADRLGTATCEVERVIRRGVAGEDVLEVETTPNRPDLLSVYGFAREVAALYGADVAPLDVSRGQSLGHGRREQVDVRVEDLGGCPRYIGRLFREVEIGPSPPWLKARLFASGMRSISNVVDVTNYVMQALGNPLHAFDLEKLEGERIVVRRAAPGEPIRTLDGEERRLEPGDLVIADASRPVALAGIMGSENSEVDDSTKSVLLEAANFEPLGILRSSERLGLRTEGSNRWEKGVDPYLAEPAAALATQLIVELAKARWTGETEAAGELPERPVVRFRPKRADEMIGIEIDPAEQRRRLELLGFEVEPADWTVTVPTWRARRHARGRPGRGGRALP